MSDSQDYKSKKAFFDRVLTIYGRKPVLEALQDQSLQCHGIHLADSNLQGGIIRQIRELAAQRNVPVREMSKRELSRISKNGKQDQGVAADILCPEFTSLENYLSALTPTPPRRLLALDGISNPQNFGMLIRSATAGQIDGIIWSPRNNAALGPLVIKASSGTLYRAPLLMCKALPEALALCREHAVEVCTLEANATRSLFDYKPKGHCVYVLGNETEGVSPAVRAEAETALGIPMHNGVESLNVAVTASLIAYAGYLNT